MKEILIEEILFRHKIIHHIPFYNNNNVLSFSYYNKQVNKTLIIKSNSSSFILNNGQTIRVGTIDMVDNNNLNIILKEFSLLKLQFIKIFIS